MPAAASQSLSDACSVTAVPLIRRAWEKREQSGGSEFFLSISRKTGVKEAVHPD